uniref:uncharacterized protein n=1 Tax=Myxine glutinosa TaxID=7769 RepID=UPI00358E3B3F
MLNFCCVVGCSNRSNRDKDVSFYCIPTVLEHQGDHAAKLSKERRERWLSNIKRKGYEPAKSSRVCSEHFVRGKPAYLHDIANPDWAPTQKMGYTSCHSSSVSVFHRYERSQQRNRKADNMATAAILLELHNANPEQCPIHEQDPPVGGTETQTELSFRDIRALEKNVEELQKDNIALRTQVCGLEEKIRATGLQEEHFQSNDAKLRFYTGLPSWAIFLPLFTFTSCALPTCKKLTKFGQVLMFLMKLRSNIFDEDLAYRFGVSQSTVSRNFHRVLDVMFVKTQSLIHWPSRDALRLSMLSSFRKFFRKCAVIIDCTEVFIEQPSDLLARAQVWSNYKHHSTVKFLIGITPQGSICFLSKCWGGRATDTEITENSDLMNKLMPGDLVLADRGFFVDEYCGMAIAEVKVPPSWAQWVLLGGLRLSSTMKPPVREYGDSDEGAAHSEDAKGMRRVTKMALFVFSTVWWCTAQPPAHQGAQQSMLLPIIV